MKKSILMLLFAGYVLANTTVVSARGTPEYGIVNIEPAMQPVAHFDVPEFICTGAPVLITEVETPLPCDNERSSALCGDGDMPSVDVSGRYWCSNANDIYNRERLEGYSEPKIIQRDRHGNFKFVTIACAGLAT